MSNDPPEDSARDLPGGQAGRDIFIDLDAYTDTVDNLDKREETTVKPSLSKPLHFLQEETRGQLAHKLVLLFAISSLFTMGYAAFRSSDADKSESLITLVLTSQVALTSGALGFYFGQNSQAS